MKVVVSYDIADDRKRKKVHDLLEMLLPRVQYSVFEGEVPAGPLERVIRDALTHLEPETDSLRVYRLCASCAGKVDVYGLRKSLGDEPVRIL